MKYKQPTGIFTMLKNNEQKNEVLKKIFIYHDMKPTDELKQIWKEDLEHLRPNVIEAAWNRWRADEKNGRFKPKSYDIVNIAKNLHVREPVKNHKTEIKNDHLEYGRSFTQDKLKEIVDLGYRNNPDLIEHLRSTSSIYEKLQICAVAQELDLHKLSSLFRNLEYKLNKQNTEQDKKIEENETISSIYYFDDQNQTKSAQISMINKNLSNLSSLI